MGMCPEKQMKINLKRLNFPGQNVKKKLTLKVSFDQSSSFSKGCLSLNVRFHGMLSSMHRLELFVSGWDHIFTFCIHPYSVVNAASDGL